MTERNRPDFALNGRNRQFTSRELNRFLASCLFFSSLIVVLSANSWGNTFGRPINQSTQSPRNAGGNTYGGADQGADDEKDLRPLELGQAIKRKLAGDEIHPYQIKLTAGQFLKVIVEQQGIDVVVQLSGPSGEQIAEFDREGRSHGQELVLHVAEAEGEYRLMVRPRQKTAPAGGYEIRAEELRAATENDLILHEGRKLFQEGVKLFRAGEYGEALPLVERSREIREKILGPEDRDLADALNLLGSLHWIKGEYAQAEPLYQRALAIRERALGAEHPDIAKVLHNLALLYADTADYAKAELFCQRALIMKEKLLGPDHLDVATSLNNLATLHHERGDYAKAEPFYLRALNIWEKARGAEHSDIAIALNNLASLYDDKGDYAKAEPLFQRALAIREKSLGPDHPFIGISLNNLAVLYKVRGDYVKAEQLYQHVMKIAEKAGGPEHPDVAETLDNLANLYQAKGDYANAEQFHKRALNIWENKLGPTHPQVARCLHRLATLYRNREEYAKAEPLLQRALAIWEKTIRPDHRYIAASLDELAILYAAKGDLAQAIKVQARANSISESNLKFNLKTGSERQKLAYLALFSKETDFTLSLHSRVAPDDPQALDLAFATLLRRKGRGLDVIADTIATLRRHATPEDQTLFDQLAAARSQLAVLTFRESGTDNPETYRARIKSLGDKVEELESILSVRSAEFRAQKQPVTLTAVQAALPAGGVLVEFAAYTPQDPRNNKIKLPPRYLAYLLTAQGRPKWIDLGEAAPIDRAIASWRRALRDPRRTDVTRLARVVNAKVMQPVLALARPELGETRHLLIAPDGLLSLVPFAALVDRQGRYLIENYSISYLLSGRDLLRLPLRLPSKQDAVVVADPDYGEMEGTIVAKSRDVGLPPGLPHSAGTNISLANIYFPPLKGTAGEARALKTILPRATIFTGEQATEAALKQLHSPSILHIATHGFFLRDQELRLVGTRDAAVATVRSGLPSDQIMENSLLRSGLALAGANLRHGRADQEDDGVLTALEAAILDLWGTKLVVLSACDTGVGEVKNGEGIQGLRRALVLAGSETQVMSLWPVSDLGTRDLMIKYYKALQQGEGRGDGLRQVQLEMLKRKDRRHPFYWASFIQSGEWANLEGQRRGSTRILDANKAGVMEKQLMNQETENSVEKEILQIANDTFTAIKDKDTKKLEDILAEDFVYRNPIEGEQSRAEFLAVIGSLPMKLTSVWSDDMKVNIYADVVVMTGTQKAKIQTEDGKEEVGATAFVDVFVKRQGRWKLVLGHGTYLTTGK